MPGADASNYSVSIIKVVDPISGFAPAAATWADFDRNQFARDTAESLGGGTSVLQDKLRFDLDTNRSPSDVGTTGAAIEAILDLNAATIRFSGLERFATLEANNLVHEIGHDLDAIHLRDRSHNYIQGDVMGSDGSSADAPGAFGPVFSPLVRFALGLPVTVAQYTTANAYYFQYTPIEKYRFNTTATAAQPHDTDTDLEVGSGRVDRLRWPGCHRRQPA